MTMQPTTDDSPLTAPRNRIKAHRKVRAGELVTHEWNFRLHPEVQRAALASIYAEVGFARSLLVYELPDGRLKLIDGHLRRDFDPDMEVDVEVLDVNDEEARQLLLSIDTFTALAERQEQIHKRLLETTPARTPGLSAAWQQTLDDFVRPRETNERDISPDQPEKYLVLINCNDEDHQLELLARFQEEGLTCKALLS
jgi:hypothetical protein